MKRVLDHDPMTGITSYFEQEESTGRIHLSQECDVQAELDYCKGLANHDDYSKQGIKDEFWHYAHLPVIVIEQLLKKGINVYAKGTIKDVIKAINTDYPHLKTTSGMHR